MEGSRLRPISLFRDADFLEAMKENEQRITGYHDGAGRDENSQRTFTRWVVTLARWKNLSLKPLILCIVAQQRQKSGSSYSWTQLGQEWARVLGG